VGSLASQVEWKPAIRAGGQLGTRQIVGHFHEKAGSRQVIFLVVPTLQSTADQREAPLAFNLSFLEKFFWPGHR
jgi:hypothetical protein